MSSSDMERDNALLPANLRKGSSWQVASGSKAVAGADTNQGGVPEIGPSSFNI